MPVVDSKNLYDILLGRDWLHAVNAVAHYAKNQYKISRDGKTAKLQGCIYTQREVELASSSSESDETSDDEDSDSSRSDEEEDKSEEDNETVDAFLAVCVRLDDLDVKPCAEALRI